MRHELLRGLPTPDHPPLGGRRCVFEWQLDHLGHFLFEIPTKQLRPHLPEGVYPVEPRPGVSLLDIGFVAWTAGNGPHGAWPGFSELSVLVVVQSDLSIDMPTPKFSFFVWNINADLADFLAVEPAALHLPTTHLPDLSVDFDPDRYAVSLTDGDGRPVASLRNTHPRPSYRPVDFVGQFFTVEHGRLWHGLWQLEGRAMEHQRDGDAGRLHPHPAFRGLPVDRCDEVYLQIFSDPHGRCVQRFFEPTDRGPARFA